MRSYIISGLAKKHLKLAKFSASNIQSYQYLLLLFGLVMLFFFLFFTSLNAQTQHNEKNIAASAKDWMFNGNSKKIQGIGIADYSQFNPEKSWNKAFEYAVQDLNANHSLLVYHYGYQIGRGPLHKRSNYAIRNFLDSTQVSVVDSARWKGQAFLLVEPKISLPDSLIYPSRKFKTVHDSITNKTAVSSQPDQWIRTMGATPRINSNWNMSITKAKQKALRNLAEDLAVKVTNETYSKNNVQRRYYNFSTVYAFQRIKAINRSFDADSFKVELAIDPNEIKMLLEE
ncbi:hypothetical protein [Fodinibius sp. SL11]|uniref:hypothetical protein n=1 Tax=Fodinibius sp. SL11 TaxID=3425690 RepID=UPI003F8807C4